MISVSISPDSVASSSSASSFSFYPLISLLFHHHQHHHLLLAFVIIIMVAIGSRQSSIHSLLSKWSATGNRRMGAIEKWLFCSYSISYSFWCLKVPNGHLWQQQDNNNDNGWDTSTKTKNQSMNRRHHHHQNNKERSTHLVQKSRDPVEQPMKETVCILVL